MSQLIAPLVQGDLRHDYQMETVARLLLVLVLFNLAEQGYRLNCLPEAHLVGEDSIQAGLVYFVEPVEPLDLVVL